MAIDKMTIMTKCALKYAYLDRKAELFTAAVYKLYTLLHMSCYCVSVLKGLVSISCLFYCF